LPAICRVPAAKPVNALCETNHGGWFHDCFAADREQARSYKGYVALRDSELGRGTCGGELAREGFVPASGDVAAVPASSRASALLPGIFGVDYSACKQVSREESKTLKSTSDRLCRRRRSALARDLPGTGSKTGKCVISDKPRRLIHDCFAADRGQATLLHGLCGAD